MFCIVVVGSADERDNQKAFRLHGNAKQADHEVGSVSSHHRSLIIQETQVEQQLLICNAYTSKVPLQVVRVRTQESLNAAKPLAYKECREFNVPLQEGDQLDFKAGRLDVGTFYATGLPKYKGSLLLVARRRNPHAVGISFESHAFAQVENPQIVVLDAYHGAEKGAVKIIENLPAHQGQEQAQPDDAEELKFNSVVAVNPGSYEISLLGKNAQRVSTAPLQAAGQGKYVVLRIGSEDSASKSGHYSQELVVFPNGNVRCFLSFLVGIVAMGAFGGL